MSTSHKTLAIALIGILLIAGMLPSIQSLQTDAIEEPEYYEVIRYNMRGITYDKETIRVSYEDAMAIKQQLEQLESLPDTTEKNRRRNALFFNNNLLSEKRCNLFSRVFEFGNNNFDFVSNHRDYGESFLSMLMEINGTLGPSYINLMRNGVFFLSFAKGVDLQLSALGISDPYHFQTENMVKIFAFMLFGEIKVFPFYSPWGYIKAIALFGNIIEY